MISSILINKGKNMKIKIEKKEFTCAGCERDHVDLAVEVSKQSGLEICYDCAFASLKFQQIMERA